jgi:hypothetical protein
VVIMGSTPRRTALAIAVLALVLLCAAGAWATRASAVSPLVVPGASEVAVESRGLGDLRVSYRVEGQAYGWRDLVWQRLIAQGWRGRDYTFGTTLRFTVTSYRRTRELGPLRIEENAVVGGDPDDPGLVIIEFHRRLRLRQWP